MDEEVDVSDAWARAVAQVDGYCERIGDGFWAEPLNAVTNAAFLIGAWLAWREARRLGRQADWAVIALVAILTAIGIGSFLFHTFATRWAAAADVLPILIFILVYLYLATKTLFDLPVWAGFLAVAMFFPFTAASTSLLQPIFGSLNGSMGYVPTFLLLLGYAAALHWRERPGAQGLALAAGLLAVSLTFRTLDDQDGALCRLIPIGTHWLWHVFNGTLLGLLVMTMARHGARARRLPV